MHSILRRVSQQQLDGGGIKAIFISFFISGISVIRGRSAHFLVAAERTEACALGCSEKAARAVASRFSFGHNSRGTCRVTSRQCLQHESLNGRLCLHVKLTPLAGSPSIHPLSARDVQITHALSGTLAVGDQSPGSIKASESVEAERFLKFLWRKFRGYTKFRCDLSVS